MKRPTSSRKRFKAFLSDVKIYGKAAILSTDGSLNGSPSAQKKNYIRKQCIKWLPEYKKTAALILTYALLAMVASLAQPLFARHIIDNVLVSQALSQTVKLRELTQFLFWMVASLICAVVFELLQNRVIAVMNSRLVARARQAIYHHVLRLPLHTISDLKVGGVTTILNSDASMFGNLLEHTTFAPAIESMRILIGITIVLSINWRLAIILIASIPLMVLLSIAFVQKMRPIYGGIYEENSTLNSRVAEVISGIKVVRCYSREKAEETQYTMNSNFIVRAALYSDLLKRMIDSGWSIVVAITLLLSTVIGSYLSIKGLATVGDLTAISMYISITIAPVFRLVNSQSQVQSSLAAADRIFALLEMPLDIMVRHDVRPVPARVETISFDHVSFGYQPDRLILDKIDFKVNSGNLVALVGRSGAGKTTLTNLLAGFYRPTTGCVQLNGVNINNFDTRSYRRLFGIVDQEVFLFDGTIRENILMGNVECDMDAVINAAKLANAHEFIQALPDGYETVVGERAYTLSGGQRQRLSIARAFLANSQILIMDEPTSNLDSESEKKIQEALQALMKGRTTFVVAHRLSTIAAADTILVLNNGRVTEQGNHESLVNAKGVYWELVRSQFSWH